MSSALRADAERVAADPLRVALRADGWATGVFGVLLLFGAVPLRDPLGLPTAWSIPFGVAMVSGGLALLLIAGYPVISTRHAGAVVMVNGASAVGMTALAFSGLIDLTTSGIGFLLIGAVIVACFAVLEYRGMRRAVRFSRMR